MVNVEPFERIERAAQCAVYLTRDAAALAAATHNTPQDGAYRALADVERIAAGIAHDAAQLAGGEYRPEYNGWRNRETWNAALWISNEQGSDEWAREIVRGVFADRATDYPGDADTDRSVRLNNAADALRDWHEEEHGPRDASGPLADAWTYAVAVVDWRTIAEHYADELRR